MDVTTTEAVIANVRRPSQMMLKESIVAVIIAT